MLIRPTYTCEPMTLDRCNLTAADSLCSGAVHSPYYNHRTKVGMRDRLGTSAYEPASEASGGSW